MSRAFYPPDTLSKEDIRATRQVRKEIWTNGMKGLMYGSASGLALHTLARFAATKREVILGIRTSPLQFNRNTAFFSTLLGGAVGSFAMATSTGKNEVHHLHKVFESGRKATSPNDDDDRRRRRMSRREAVSRNLEEGQGLSDGSRGRY